MTVRASASKAEAMPGGRAEPASSGTWPRRFSLARTDLAALIHQDEHLDRAHRQLAGLVEDLLADGIAPA